MALLTRPSRLIRRAPVRCDPTTLTRSRSDSTTSAWSLTLGCAAGHARGRAGAAGTGQRMRRSRRRARAGQRRRQGDDAGRLGAGRGQLDRRLRQAARRVDRAGPGPPGLRPIDDRHVPALVHLGFGPPAGPGRRRGAGAGLGQRRRAWAVAVHHRYGLHDLRGLRAGQTRRRVRSHQGPRLPPAAGIRCRHRRPAWCPAARRQCQHRARGGRLHHRDGQPGPCRRRHRAAYPAGRLGLLRPPGGQGLPAGRGALLDHRQGQQGGPQGDPADPRRRLGRRSATGWRAGRRWPRPAIARSASAALRCG
jgi:hypothetical protein